MSRYRKSFYKILASLLIVSLVSFNNSVFAQNGEELFKNNCANCHHPLEDRTGPHLKGARDREPSKDWAYKWVKSVNTMVETDAYAKGLLAKYGTKMQQFDNLKDEEIKAILDYADKFTPPPPPPEDPNGGGKKGEDNSLLFGILTIILAVIALILLQVNSSLRKLSDEKEGILRSEPVPFYRNKSYLFLGVLVLFFVGGYFAINGAIGLGRMKNYQPEQPIFYSHKVHAGTNQISCLYCHGGAQDSKQASIPSVNVCMNCHKGIKEYKGEPIFRENGLQVNGTAEIQKLYEYAGWNVNTQKYNPDNNGDGVPDGAHPIQWVKIHNLPDHVYFNHSQHIKVGKQQCQTCHGPIQEMPEVKQFADLSMGWCINCHRESKVNFNVDSTGNKFYSLYEKLHKDLKPDTAKDVKGNPILENGQLVITPAKLDSITVEKIGGTECQKCHY